MKRFIKELFCIHHWKSIAGIYDGGYLGDLLKCQKCGKKKEGQLIYPFHFRYVHPLKKERVYYPDYLKRGFND